MGSGTRFGRCAVAFLLVGASVAVHSPSRAEEGEAEAARDEAARVDLVGGQSIVGRIVERELTVRTLYGTLTVPFDEVIKVRFGLELSRESQLRLKELVDVIGEEGVDSEAGKKASEEIGGLGAAAIPHLRALRPGVEGEELRKKLDELIDELHPGEDEYVDADDQVVSERFTMKGSILADALRVESLLGVIEVPCRDLRAITFRETEIKKVWKVGVQHLENGGAPLQTGVKVKKGQRISLVPSGSMSYEGNLFGPAGLMNWTWNGRQMGCLQWRIGDGAPWQILGDAFEDRAPAAGELEFCVHLTGGTVAGEFAVAFKTAAR
jgi:hypothetical protein